MSITGMQLSEAVRQAKLAEADSEPEPIVIETTRQRVHEVLGMPLDFDGVEWISPGGIVVRCVKIEEVAE